MSRPQESASQAIRAYGLGYGFAIGLTGLAFAATAWHPFDRTTTVAIVFGLGLLQMLVHFRAFLHIDLKRSSRDDLQLILFSVVIIALMVGGTLVILFNLRQRMM